MRSLNAWIIFSIIPLFIMTSAYAESTGTLEIALKFTNGDSLGSDSAEIRIYQEGNENPIKIITEKSLESTYKTELNLSEKYRIDVFTNGVFSTSTFYELNKNHELITIQIPLSHGVSFQVFHDDKITPISGINVSLFTNDGISIVDGVTNWEGKTQRFWVPPTTNNSYNAKFEINNNLTYEFSNIHLLPGGQSDLKITTPWPNTSTLEITLLNEKISESIPANTDFLVKLVGTSEIFESKINHGKAIFPKLPVGDYRVLVTDSNTFNSNLKIWANQTVTVSEKMVYENIILKKPSTDKNEIKNEPPHILTDSTYFQKNHGWSRQSAKGVQVDDENDHIIGEQSMSLQTEGDSSPVFTRSPKISDPIDLENKYVNMWIKINDPSKIKELWFSFTSDNFTKGWFTYDYSPFIEKIKSNEWTYLSFPTHNFKKTGVQSISSINRIQIRVTDAGTAPIIMKINELSFSKMNPALERSKDKATCNCVAFRLDDVQDFWLNDIQLQIMKTFEEENIPLTIGVIGKYFGDDDRVVTQIKNQLKNSKLEIANHGWEHESFIEFDTQTQKQIMKKTNDKISKVFNYKTKVFIPPFNDFDNGTVDAMKENGMRYFSSELDKSDPPYSFSGLELYDFPQTAFTGDLNSDKTIFLGLNHIVTLNQLKTSLNNYGFATITMHPQEFSIIKNGTYVNEVNSNQLSELRELIKSIKESKIKLVPISEINSNVSEMSQIPSWIKNNAGWWADGKIDDNSFVLGIQFLIKEKVIEIPQHLQNSKTMNEQIPSWIRNNAKWWSNGEISETDFLKGVEYLTQQGIIKVN